MARTKLSGLYGSLATAAQTPTTTGTLTADAKYIVTTVGGSTVLASGATAGYLYVADGTEDITSSGDVLILLTESTKCDLTNWTLEFTKAEIDVSTICSDIKEYVEGRTDSTGTIDGIFYIGVTDVNDGIQNAFIDISRQADPGGTITIDTINGDQILLLLYTQDSTASGETESLYVVPAILYSFGANAGGEEAQTFSSTFRPAPNEDIKMHYATIVHA
jgi:hypothetical protein